jgi:hypothetical protein
VETILTSLAFSAQELATRMERRMNTYLILGITIGAIGLGVWSYANQQGTAAATVPGGFTLLETFMLHTLPRITILLFIEVLAGFFLRQYRIGVEDFKYFLQLKRQADSNQLIYAFGVAQKDDTLRVKFLDALIAQTASGRADDTLKVMELAENPNVNLVETLGGTAQEIIKAMAAAAGNAKGK